MGRKENRDFLESYLGSILETTALTVHLKIMGGLEIERLKLIDIIFGKRDLNIKSSHQMDQNYKFTNTFKKRYLQEKCGLNLFMVSVNLK